MKPRQVIFGILYIMLGGMIFAVIGYVFFAYKSDMRVFTFYMTLFTGAALILLPIGTTVAFQGVRLLVIQGKRERCNLLKEGFGKTGNLIISIIYATCAVIGLISGVVPKMRNIAIIKEDLGIEIATVLDILFIGGTITLGLLSIEHAATALGKKVVLPWRAMGGSMERKTMKNKKRITAMAHYEALLLAGLLAGGAVGYVLVPLFQPPTCFNGNHGFSDPPYNLSEVQSGTHFETGLDNGGIVNQTLLDGLEKAMWAMTKLQSQGGFPMESLQNGSEMYSDRGESCPLHPGEFSMQGGTPRIAQVYLAMYELEPNPIYLQVATRAAEALLAVQDNVNGGFYYDGRRYPDGTGYQPHPRNYRRAAIFDDNVMQSCLNFLLDIYNATGNSTYRDAAVEGFDYLFELEIEGGGWPQRSNYKEDEYPSYVTLNDGCMEDIIMVMLKAYNLLGDSRYLEAVERAARFLINVQGNGRGSNSIQMAWAQQYNRSNVPSWARAFEPPAFCSSQTGAAIRMLMETYLYTGNESYLDPIPAAIAWLNDINTTIRNTWEDPSEFVWARLYEPETNRLIVGNRNNQRTGPIYYYDYVPSRDFGYSWIGTYSLNSTMDKYDILVNTFSKNITEYLAWRSTPTPPSEGSAKNAMDGMTDDGFYLDGDGMIDDSSFCSKAYTMINYFKSVVP
ncbi:hypothetical protein GF325_02595 [Candidatus Bathyarchaeota archaeon]|nr:hypothetical protein [Candidatus Bathyarchaeota archaeon]